jgi:hypothetical protein
MAKRLRTTTALAILSLLLLAQLAPVLDVCVCDPDQPRVCCQKKSAPVAEPSGCCSSSAHSGTHAESLDHASRGNGVALSSPSCKRQEVSLELSAAELPSTMLHPKAQMVAMITSIPTLAVPSRTMTPVQPDLRAPPPGTGPSLFLLNASFLT